MKYRVIVADPPWAFRNSGGNGAAQKHYSTMGLGELAGLDIESLAAPDSVLLLWATWATLPEAMLLQQSWGFSYVTGFPWVKLTDPVLLNLFGEVDLFPTYGVGFWVRGCSEPVLVGRRGNPPLPSQNFLGILSERFHHSRKPENLYDYAESFPGPYLELFARRPRPGWDSWGLEVEGEVEVGIKKEGAG